MLRGKVITPKSGHTIKGKYLAISVHRGVVFEVESCETYDEAKAQLLFVAASIENQSYETLQDANEGENHYSIWEWNDEEGTYEDVT